MASTFVNFLTTIGLTLLCSLILLVFYRHAVRPILLKHNIIPLQHLPSTLSQRWSEYTRLRADADDDHLEQGFLDGDSDDDDDDERRRSLSAARERGRYTDEPESSGGATASAAEEGRFKHHEEGAGERAAAVEGASQE